MWHVILLYQIDQQDLHWNLIHVQVHVHLRTEHGALTLYDSIPDPYYGKRERKSCCALIQNSVY